MNDQAFFPTNKNLLVCLVCLSENRRSIYGELLKDSIGWKVVNHARGDEWLITTRTEMILVCAKCGSSYVFKPTEGCFVLKLAKPANLPVEINKFYALTLSGGTV